MRSKMIYSVPIGVTMIILYPKEFVIRYKSELLNRILYKFTTYKETLDAYELCLNLMEHFKTKRKFKGIEIAFKKMIELKLEDLKH